MSLLRKIRETGRIAEPPAPRPQADPPAGVAAGLHTTWPTLPAATSPASGVGIVEGWRGTITTHLETAADHTLTNKSFYLSYAGNDL
ncbi:hypothetical protein ACFVTP_31755 [Streptomyces celluloflavus]|uniref:hypothetical protein n=1 Tax=Streptomyces celluloflavus TaxID=58344 RepID=UPI0036D7D640